MEYLNWHFSPFYNPFLSTGSSRYSPGDEARVMANSVGKRFERSDPPPEFDVGLGCPSSGWPSSQSPRGSSERGIESAWTGSAVRRLLRSIQQETGQVFKNLSDWLWEVETNQARVPSLVRQKF